MDAFKVHGTYSCGLMGYEIEISGDNDRARLRSYDSHEKETVTDWLWIETVYPDEPDDESDGESVIDPDGYNIPLSEVFRA